MLGIRAIDGACEKYVDLGGASDTPVYLYHIATTALHLAESKNNLLSQVVHTMVPGWLHMILMRKQLNNFVNLKFHLSKI